MRGGLCHTMPMNAATRGNPEQLATTPSNQDSLCVVEGCSAAVHIKKHGLCRAHYFSHYHKKLIAVSEKPTACAVQQCDDPGPYIRGFCKEHYRRWQRYGDPVYQRPTPPDRSPRIPDGMNSASEIARMLGISRQRAHQLMNQNKHRARLEVHFAIERGTVAKPPFCFRCGNETEDLEAHHWDYDRPLDVGWFCPTCHSAVHPHARGARKAMTS